MSRPAFPAGARGALPGGEQKGFTAPTKLAAPDGSAVSGSQADSPARNRGEMWDQLRYAAQLPSQCARLALTRSH